MTGEQARRAIARWTLPGVVLVAGLLELAQHQWRGWLVTVPLMVILAVALAMRRERPRWAGVAALVIQLVFVVANGVHYDFPSTTVGLALIALMYVIARHCPWPESGWWVAASLVVPVARRLAGASGPEDFLPDGLLALAVIVGYLVRNRAEVEAARYRRMRRAEREQIARDVHDVIAHGLSSIAVYAEGAAFVADPDTAEGRALAKIRDTARATLGETREVVTRLRDTADGPGRPHGLDQVASLLEASVPPARLHLVGDPSTLSEHLSRALYRIIQESLSNVRRHARQATTTDVTLTIDPEKVSLLFVDDGIVQPNSTPGYGLRGINDRAALLGGTASAGNGPSGGWVVRVEIPLRSPVD